MFLKIEHVGVAVRSIASSARVFSGLIGMPLGPVESVDSEGVRVAFLGEGETHLELLEPLGEAGPVARHIERRGEGVHHVCFSVDDIEAAVASLKEAGLQPVGEAPREGAGGCRVAFMHPKDASGVLVELSQPAGRRPERVTPGQTVVVYLQSPKERFWGVLREIAAWGVTVEGIELSSFEAWLSGAASGEVTCGASTAMFPLHRIERILLDRPSGGAESLEERFRARAGTSLAAFLARGR